MFKGDSLWQNLVENATLSMMLSPEATGNVVSAAEQGLILAWRYSPGMKATAKDAAGQGYAPLVTERERGLNVYGNY
jgi:hypothetical protein